MAFLGLADIMYSESIELKEKILLNLNSATITNMTFRHIIKMIKKWLPANTETGYFVLEA